MPSRMAQQDATSSADQPWRPAGSRIDPRDAEFPVARRRSPLKSLAKEVYPYLAALAVVAAITLFYRTAIAVNVTTVGFTFLLAILCASTFGRLPLAVFMSVAATLAYDYFFLPPVGNFTVTDPQDYVALSAFLVTSLIGSNLSIRARSQAKEAERRRREMELLYAFGQKLMSAGNPMELLSAIPGHLVDCFRLGAAALFVFDTAESYYAGVESLATEDPPLRDVLMQEDVLVEPKRDRCLIPVRAGTRKVAIIRLSGANLSRATLEAIAALTAIAFERTRAVAHAGQLEAAQESERLKSALLNAITHEFRTPLTAIRAAISGLLGDIDFDRDQSRDLLAIIDEESVRMNELIGKAFEMARLEAGNVKLDLGSHPADELISIALDTCRNILRVRPVHLEVADPNDRVVADASLIANVLVHLIENAHMYSPEGEPITISTRREEGFLWFSVADRGPGIRETELSKIFEKFYRGEDQRDRIVGTGMGLAIAKGIVETHGGTIDVASRPEQGSIFTFSLPADQNRA